MTLCTGIDPFFTEAVILSNLVGANFLLTLSCFGSESTWLDLLISQQIYALFVHLSPAGMSYKMQLHSQNNPCCLVSKIKKRKQLH